MKTQVQIEDALYEWANAQVGVAPFNANVVFMDQSAPRAGRPYVTIRLETSSALGLFDEMRTVDNDGEATFVGQRVINIGLQCFGVGAIDIMNQLRASLSLVSVRMNFFDSHDISVINHGDVLNLAGLRDTEFEPRSSMDIVIAYADSDVDDVGLIETVVINGEELSLI